MFYATGIELVARKQTQRTNPADRKRNRNGIHVFQYAIL